MIGSFFTRGLVLIFGYAYPAYECYKSVELNKPDIELLRFWCQYWILVAMLTVCERIGDMCIGWIPMYGEAKLAFFIYLWFPKTKGTAYVYDSFFRPYVAKHEPEIDRNLLELRTRAADIALLYWQKSASYVQTRFFDILQYVASQSIPKPKPPTQPQNQSTKVKKPAAPSNPIPAAAMVQPQDEEPSSSSSSSSTSSSEHQEDATSDEADTSVDSKAAVSPAVPKEPKITIKQALLENTKASNSTQEQQIDSANETAPQDTAMEESGRLTRARSRKTRAASIR
ncbi:hypothetical protein MIMGU_mgv1a025455mg [Erythranthe guttata]|uniref:HVA22-like protein n=1 Tax=Erythranthe guttata TaxID=4155 RepID=A0A022QZT4_ERYGU|nr:PREDICTED: putative HVA22-like protein g [Erythranthe guttata]EYU33962.1 hypothetical protein MIMGU_mgv1a025455mg [Erythranthe guttata]|eukprot:XP_012841540.1 PREDICTED: putative HVA22-like protein g [Erythranthe guttata]